jgi:hypothetical protein
MAQVTRTPIGYFQSSKQVASAESQKQDESPLIAKARDRQTPFGNAWEDVFRMGRKLHNVYGPGGLTEDLGIEIEWEELETRNDREVAETAKLHKELGVPEPYVWPMLGYTPEEVQTILDSEEYQSRRAFAQLGLMTANAPSEDEEEGDDE